MYKWWHWILATIIIIVVALGVRYFWPRIVEIEKTVEVPVEKVVEKTIEVPIETECSNCNTIFVDLEKDAPEGVWSNASGLLLADGWCAVLERDQSWQQARDETELRKTWEQGATEDFLLLCNPGPGSRFYSLQDEYGSRPRDWWNDQVKKTWFFCLTEVAEDSPNDIAVLYEHDNDQLEEGWEFPILQQK